MIDDICHSVLKNSRLACPKHGEQVVALIAPDLAFNDIEDKYLITKQKLCIESLLGRGSFGSVYCGSLGFSNNNNNSNSNAKDEAPTESSRRDGFRWPLKCSRRCRMRTTLPRWSATFVKST